jgi:hypothetical protein
MTLRQKSPKARKVWNGQKINVGVNVGRSDFDIFLAL